MPKFKVKMYDYVRIDAEVIVEAENAAAARTEAARLWNEDAAEITAENTWESWDEGVQIEGVQEQ